MSIPKIGKMMRWEFKFIASCHKSNNFHKLNYSKLDDVDTWEGNGKDGSHLLMMYREFDDKQMGSFEYVDAEGHEMWGQCIVKDNSTTINKTLEYDPYFKMDETLPLFLTELCLRAGGKKIQKLFGEAHKKAKAKEIEERRNRRK